MGPGLAGSGGERAAGEGVELVWVRLLSMLAEPVGAEEVGHLGLFLNERLSMCPFRGRFVVHIALYFANIPVAPLPSFLGRQAS